MIKTIYAIAWFVVGIAAFISILAGSFGAAAMVVFSLIALGLFYGFALWSVTVNTREPHPHAQYDKESFAGVGAARTK